MTMIPSERGGVLGAMDIRVQRGWIQEQRLHCEHKEHDSSLPLVGMNTLLPKEHGCEVASGIELIRSIPEDEGQQIAHVAGCAQARNDIAAVGRPPLQAAAREEETFSPPWRRA